MQHHRAMGDERKASIKRTLDMLEKATYIHKKLLHGKYPDEAEGRAVRALIRDLVEQWV